MKAIKNELIWFVSITFPLTYGVGLFFWSRGLPESLGFRMAMYVPAIVVILLYLLKFRKPVLKNNDLGLNFSGLRYWIVAPISLSLLCFITYGISYLFNPEMFSGVDTIKNTLIEKGFYWGNIYTGLIVIFLLNSIAGSLLNIPMFLGEELGWRGFMTPRLMKLLGPKPAFLAGGAIWALWHLIMIAQGLNYPGHFVAGIFMMILFAIPAGIIIQYFYVKSGSVIVAALAHAGLNKSVMTVSFILGKDKYNTLLYGPTGIIGILLFYLVAIYLFKQIDWESAYAQHFSE